MREKWKVRRGWMKVHAMIDVESNQVLGLEITDESVRDDQKFVPLLDQVQQHCGEEHPIYRILADGAYDHNDLFNLLEKRGILPGIKTRNDVATHSTGSLYRAECVRERQMSGGYQRWSWITNYGM